MLMLHYPASPVGSSVFEGDFHFKCCIPPPAFLYLSLGENEGGLTELGVCISTISTPQSVFMSVAGGVRPWHRFIIAKQICNS